MTRKDKRLPDISLYIDLINRFVNNSMTAPEFERAYLQAIKHEQRILGDPVYPILQELFEDADAYVEDPRLRTDPEDLDDDQLRACARRTGQALSDLGYGSRG